MKELKKGKRKKEITQFPRFVKTHLKIDDIHIIERFIPNLRYRNQCKKRICLYECLPSANFGSIESYMALKVICSPK